MDGQSAQARRARPGRRAATYTGPKASFDRFERVQDGQARSREDRKWRKEFERSRQLLSDQIRATAD
ncbi:MAG: hypothetical protein EBZ48_02625 [Proteobacteria bacterium]|nr:hypothetical protein [Pseudomonadota bacterium]